MKVNKELYLSLGILLAVSFLIFGIIGLVSFIIMSIIFFLPFYFYLKKTNLEEDESIIFSFFIGIGIFSLIVFYVNRIAPSFRISIFVSLGLMLCGIFLFSRYKKNEK